MEVLDELVVVQRRKWFPPVVILLGLLFFILAGYFWFVRPAQLVNEAKTVATQRVEQVTLTLAKADSALGTMGWFTPAYTEKPAEAATKARQILSGSDQAAEKLMAQAAKGGGWRKRLKLYKQTISACKEANGAATWAIEQMVAAHQRKDDALAKAGAFSTGLDSVKTTLATIEARVESEIPNYPRKYGADIAGRQRAGEQQLAALSPIGPRFAKFLPPATDTNQHGDPDAALEVLNPAFAREEVLRQLCLDAINWLNITRTQYENAPEEVLQGETQVAETVGRLDARKNRTGYWLKAATATFGQAQTKAKSARKILTAVLPGEKVADRPEAYRTAEAAMALCAKAIQDADAEIALAKAVLEQKEELKAQINQLASVAGSVQESLRLLEANHARSAWAQYINIGVRSGARRVTDAYAGLDRINKLSSLEVQEFAQADELVRAQLSEIASTISAGQSFVEFAHGLENARSQFYNAEDHAKRVIDDQESDVSQYGSYSSSDQNDFEEAQKLLRRAKDRAAERLFVEAVELATQAASLADGTGENCRRAHQRKVDDENSTHNTWDSGSSGSDGGGSSGWGGSDGGSSGGGYDGGGSDSDAGGGSDSDAGGGSDSDY